MLGGCRAADSRYRLSRELRGDLEVSDELLNASTLVRRACDQVGHDSSLRFYLKTPADFFAAFKGETDDVPVATEADAVAGRLHIYKDCQDSALTSRPRCFQIQNLAPCESPLPPLAAMRQRASSPQIFAEFLTPLIELGFLSLRDLRSLAITCFAARAVVSGHLRATDVRIDAAVDASWENAAFLARLPNLQRLHIEGEQLVPIIDVRGVRSKERLRLASADGKQRVGTAAALFLGAVLGGSHTTEGVLLRRGTQHTIRLTDNVSYMSLDRLHTDLSDFDQPFLSPADVLILLGTWARATGGPLCIRASAKVLRDVVNGAVLSACSGFAGIAATVPPSTVTPSSMVTRTLSPMIREQIVRDIECKRSVVEREEKARMDEHARSEGAARQALGI